MMSGTFIFCTVVISIMCLICWTRNFVYISEASLKTYSTRAEDEEAVPQSDAESESKKNIYIFVLSLLSCQNESRHKQISIQEKS